MSLLPSSPDVTPESDPRVVGVDSDEADDLMSALSSTTARRLVAQLHDEPAPPSKLADELDTTIQNVQYHLSNLEDAGVVEVVGTGYSEKGREMDVYAPADDPLVIFAGREERASGLRAAVSRLLGGVAALALGAVAVQETFGRSIVETIGFASTGSAPGDGGGGGGGDGASGGGNVSDLSATEIAADGSTGTEVDAGATTTPTPSGGDGGVGIAEVTETATETLASPSGTLTPATTPTGTPMPSATGTATPLPTATPTPTAVPTATPTPTPTPAATQTATEAVTTVAGGGLEASLSLPPGVLFFLGGLVVLAVGLATTGR